MRFSTLVAVGVIKALRLPEGGYLLAIHQESDMGLLNEIIGAVVAEEAVNKLDPNAGFLKKGFAAVAGFEGEKLIEEKIEEPAATQNNPDTQDPQA